MRCETDMPQLELPFRSDHVRESIESIDAPRLVKALLLTLHQQGGRITDLNRYYARFHVRDVPTLKRTVVGAIRRGLVAPEGSGIRLTITQPEQEYGA